MRKAGKNSSTKYINDEINLYYDSKENVISEFERNVLCMNKKNLAVERFVFKLKKIYNRRYTRILRI